MESKFFINLLIMLCLCINIFAIEYIVDDNSEYTTIAEAMTAATAPGQTDNEIIINIRKSVCERYEAEYSNMASLNWNITIQKDPSLPPSSIVRIQSGTSVPAIKINGIALTNNHLTITINDLVFNDSRTPTASYIFIKNANTTISNCKFSNVYTAMVVSGDQDFNRNYTVNLNGNTINETYIIKTNLISVDRIDGAVNINNNIINVDDTNTTNCYNTISLYRLAKCYLNNNSITINRASSAPFNISVSNSKSIFITNNTIAGTKGSFASITGTVADTCRIKIANNNVSVTNPDADCYGIKLLSSLYLLDISNNNFTEFKQPLYTHFAGKVTKYCVINNNAFTTSNNDNQNTALVISSNSADIINNEFNNYSNALYINDQTTYNDDYPIEAIRNINISNNRFLKVRNTALYLNQGNDLSYPNYGNNLVLTNNLVELCPLNNSGLVKPAFVYTRVGKYNLLVEQNTFLRNANYYAYMFAFSSIFTPANFSITSFKNNIIKNESALVINDGVLPNAFYANNNCTSITIPSRYLPLAGNNIVADPLLTLSYELSANSPCIDAGYFSNVYDPDGSVPDMGWRPYFKTADTKRYKNGWNWIGYPRLNVNALGYQNAYGTTGLLGNASPIVTGFTQLLANRNYNQTGNNNIDLTYIQPDWQNGIYNQLYRYEGYKVNLNNASGYVQNNINGSWLETPFSCNVYTTAEYWFCYTLHNTQNIVDALGTNLDKVQSIRAQNWYYERPENPAYYYTSSISKKETYDPTNKYLEYGMTYIITVNQNISNFSFQSNNNVFVVNQPLTAQYFSYNDLPDYEVIEVAGVDSLQNVSEIGVFQGETCVGARAVEEFPVQILTYSDPNNPETQELSFRVITDAKGDNKLDYIKYNHDGFEDNTPILARKNHLTSVRLTASKVEQITPIREVQLQQNYPNPFNPNTTIAFKMPQTCKVDLKIYNIKGQVVKSLLSGEIKAGAHSIIWNGTDNNGKKAGSGIYFYRIQTNGQAQTRKMLLIK